MGHALALFTRMGFGNLADLPAHPILFLPILVFLVEKPKPRVTNSRGRARFHGGENLCCQKQQNPERGPHGGPVLAFVGWRSGSDVVLFRSPRKSPAAIFTPSTATPAFAGDPDRSGFLSAEGQRIATAERLENAF